MLYQDESSRNYPLRILQMGSTAYRGGVTTAITTLCKSLHQEGHEVMLVTDGGDLKPLSRQGIHCVIADFAQKPMSILRGAMTVNQAVRRFQPDVIHVHGRAPALCCYLSGRMPDWFTLHNTHFTERVGLMDVGFLRRCLSPRGRRFFVLDEKAQTYLQHSMGIKPSNVDVIINGVDCSYYYPPTAEERKQARAQFGVKDEQTLVLFVGRLHPSKQPLAVTAAAKVARDAGRQDLCFAIVGEGDMEEEVRHCIESENLQNNCKLYGWMNPRQAYFAADLLVMPSLYEGFGMVGIEAMATGLPVLRTRTGGAEKMIIEGETGFSSSTDRDEFIHLLMEILQQPKKLNSMRNHAHEWVRLNLSSQVQTTMIVQHYRKHLRQRGPKFTEVNFTQA